MISEAHKFLFYDIVKTGGTSLGRILARHGGVGKHHSVARPLPDIGANASLPRDPLPLVRQREYFRFTIVRNPFDRLISLFSYCQEAPLQQAFARSGWDGILERAARRLPARARDRRTYWPTDFAQFVDWLLDYDQYFTDFEQEKYITMCEWLRDDEGSISVDFVGRYETLQADADRVLDALGLPREPLPLANPSPVQPRAVAAQRLRDDPRLCQRVQAYFREDFVAFGYPERFMEPAGRGRGTGGG